MNKVNVLVIGNGFRTECFSNKIDMIDLTKKMNLIDFTKEIPDDFRFNGSSVRNNVISKYLEFKMKNLSFKEMIVKAADENYEVFMILFNFYLGNSFSFMWNINKMHTNKRYIDLIKRIETVIKSEITEVNKNDIVDNNFLTIINDIQNYDQIWTTNYDNSLEVFLEENNLKDLIKKIRHVHGIISDPIIEVNKKVSLEYIDFEKNLIRRLRTYGLSISTDWLMFDNLLNSRGLMSVWKLELGWYTDSDLFEVKEFKKNTEGIRNRTQVTNYRTK